MKKARELKDIKLNEVSLVDKGANKKTFLFFKQDGKKPSGKKLKKNINIVIDSDGTIGGTKITLNKEEIEKLSSFNFSFWSNEDETRKVSCSYSKVVETDDGFSRSESFYLSKGDMDVNKELEKQLKAYFGEETEIDFEKAADSTEIAKAIETINEYRKDFPDELRDSIGMIAKQTGFCDIIVSKMLEKKNKSKTDDFEIDLEKAGAKFSKDTLKKLQAVAAAIDALLPEVKANTEKTEKSEVEKTVEDLKAAIKKLEEKEPGKESGKEKGTELTKTLAELTKRLATVEKSTGVSKKIDGQDDETDTDADGKKWPSISDSN